MKQLALFLITGIGLLLILLSGIAPRFVPREAAPAVIVIPVDPTVTALEARLAEQQATYQAKITVLEETLARKQADLPQQLLALDQQIAAAEQSLNTWQQRNAQLQDQLQTLQTPQTETETTLQTQIDTARRTYAQRQAELQATLAELTAVRSGN